jgi:lactoylglutathione lyase
MKQSIDFYEKLLVMNVTAKNYNRWAQFNFDGKCIALYSSEYDNHMLESNMDLDFHYNIQYIKYFKERNIRYGNNMVLNFWVENLNDEE